MTDPVLVYLYTYWDEESQSHKTSFLYATQEMIRAGLGTPIGTSALKVERGDLRDGIYTPGVKKGVRG